MAVQTQAGPGAAGFIDTRQKGFTGPALRGYPPPASASVSLPSSNGTRLLGGALQTGPGASILIPSLFVPPSPRAMSPHTLTQMTGWITSFLPENSE